MLDVPSLFGLGLEVGRVATFWLPLYRVSTLP